MSSGTRVNPLLTSVRRSGTVFGMAQVSFAERVTAAYTDRGWSIAELGRRGGLDGSLLSRLLRGEREWRLEHVEALARVFDTTAEALVGGSDRAHVLSSRQGAEVDVDVLRKRVAEALAANHALEAEKGALLDELKRRPTIEQLNTLRQQLSAAERDRKELERVVRERDALRTEVITSEAQARALKAAYARLAADAEKLRAAAVKWRDEAKRLGSKADLAAVAAGLFQGSCRLNRGFSSKVGIPC